ncbi:14835_t:CDS:2, partial [Cetraspora pellucida]
STDEDNSLAIPKVESKKINHFLACTPTFLKQHSYLKEIELSIKQYMQNNIALLILNKNESDNLFVVNNNSDNKTEVNKENEQIISVNN